MVSGKARPILKVIGRQKYKHCGSIPPRYWKRQSVIGPELLFLFLLGMPRMPCPDYTLLLDNFSRLCLQPCKMSDIYLQTQSRLPSTHPKTNRAPIISGSLLQCNTLHVQTSITKLCPSKIHMLSLKPQASMWLYVEIRSIGDNYGWMKSYEWAPNSIETWPYKKRKREISFFSHREKAATCKTRREFSSDNSSAGTLILDFPSIKSMRK